MKLKICASILAYLFLNCIQYSGKAQEPSSNPVPSQQERELLRKKREIILKDLQSILGETSGTITADKWNTLKKRYWTKSLDDQILTQNGTKPLTIKDVFETPIAKSGIIREVASGKFSYIKDTAEQEFLLAFHLLAMTSGPSLPQVVKDYINNESISRGDILLFILFSDGLIDLPQKPILTKSELDQWTSLAKSPKSIYRLLGLQTYRKVAPEPIQWIEYYKLYTDESDPAIRENLIDLIFMTAIPEAADLLSQIRSKPEIEKDSILAAKLDRSITFLRKLPPKTP
jgi:hypothetical protein